MVQCGWRDGWKLLIDVEVRLRVAGSEWPHEQCLAATGWEPLACVVLFCNLAFLSLNFQT